MNHTHRAFRLARRGRRVTVEMLHWDGVHELEGSRQRVPGALLTEIHFNAAILRRDMREIHVILAHRDRLKCDAHRRTIEIVGDLGRVEVLQRRSLHSHRFNDHDVRDRR